MPVGRKPEEKETKRGESKKEKTVARSDQNGHVCSSNSDHAAKCYGESSGRWENNGECRSDGRNEFIGEL